MNRRSVLAGGSALLLTLAASLSGCGIRKFPDYNYKMTIYADGKAFSSVRGIEQEEISSVQDSSGRTVKRRLHGEAVVLDLAGRTYFALLGKPDNADYSLLTVTATSLGPLVQQVPNQDGDATQQRQLRDPAYHLDDMAERSRAMTEIKGAHPLPRQVRARDGKRWEDNWPTFVTLDDPNDPRTARLVRPENIGVTEITIEITDDDVSTGIEQRLPWWRAYRDKRFDGTSSVMQDMRSNDIRNWLNGGWFTTVRPE
jgi:hypothetical protein